MMKKDFYDVLGVSKTASEKEIKDAYRKKTLKYHPDRYASKSKEEAQDAEKRFKEINEAYTVLSNPEKKRAYDQFGDPNAAGHNPFEGFGGQGFDQGDFPDLNDILNSFFGGGGQQQKANFRGDDLGYTLSLSLEEAAEGVEKTISVSKKDPCEVCHSTGSKPGSKPKTCSTCHGSGKVTMQQGFMAIQRVCPTCHGEGVTISDPCQKCHGKGCYTQKSNIKVRIPAGVDTNDRMRVSNKGDAGVRGAPAGDLYINIHVEKHPLFTREGVDLHCHVPISFHTACMGGEVDIATLQSPIKLKIPPETQSGSLLRLRHKGIKSVKTNQTGDIICHIVVETPINLNKDQKNLLSSFDNSLKENQRHQPKTQSFMERIKRMFGA